MPSSRFDLSNTGMCGAIAATMRDTNHAIMLMASSRSADGTSIADWERLASVGQPIIVYMPMANLPDIMSAFERGRMAHDTPTVVISSSTISEVRIIACGDGIDGCGAFCCRRYDGIARLEDSRVPARPPIWHRC